MDTRTESPFNQLRLRLFAGGAVCAFFALFGVRKVSLFTADIGRHLRNGALLLEGGDFSILRTNHYSYTLPDAPFVNHHWGFGVLVHLVHRLAGFPGLSWFYFGVLALAFAAVFRVAARASGFYPAALCAFVAIPLATCRFEVRPEGFSYLFGSLEILLLSGWRREAVGARSPRLLWLPLLAALWVNLHIYFFLGFLILGAFLAETALVRRDAAGTRTLLGVLALEAVAVFLNPIGPGLVLYPARILGSLGYSVAENAPLLAMIGAVAPLLAPLGVLSLLAIYGAIRDREERKEPFPLARSLVAGASVALAFFAVRNLALAGFFLVPAASAGAARLGRKISGRPAVLAAALAGALYLGFFLVRISPEVSNRLGAGLEEGDSAAADFFREQRLRGPIFNNFDISGYLIYHLFPGERVFFDSRPEAYPEDFIRDQYILPQEDGGEWKRLVSRYGLNAIVFAWPDRTPWGRAFIEARLRDPAWSTVYLDRHVVILLKDTAENRPVIQRFRVSD